MPYQMKLLRMFGIILLSVCALSVACLSWAYLVEPNLLFVRKVEAALPQWKNAGEPLNVVIAGDFHLSAAPYSEVRLQRYVQKIMSLQPDIILLLGDYAQGPRKINSMPPHKAAEHLKNLKAPYGVFAVQGNHDYVHGWHTWRKELTKAGIQVLYNKSAVLTLKDGRKLQLSGVRDSYRLRKGDRPKRQSPDIPNLAICHRPQLDDILKPGDVDFTISAHLHGGQVCLPFKIRWLKRLPDSPWTVNYPWHTSKGNKYLITKGLGTSRLPIRFCCPPEIFLLKLK